MARQHNIQTPGAALHQAATSQSAGQQDDNDSDVVLVGIGSPDAVIDIDGRAVAINEIVTSAFETSGMSLLEWNALEGPQRDGFIAEKRQELATLYRNADREMPSQEDARAAAQAAVARRQAARTVHPDSPAAARQAALPHRDDIDPAELKAPVLTQQGWVVHDPKPLPHKYR